MSDSFIRFAKVTKDYGILRVVQKLDLDIRRGEFVSLLGPSGSGKTTLLMMLGGFETVTDGTITLDDQRINDLPTYKRDMGVVFQNYALFPHMTIAKNVAFPLEMRGMRKAEVAKRVTKALDMVQLGHLAERLPGQLSGGQQQRVALARALVFEPRVVLMDEPLGALDKQLRERMQLDIRDLHHRLGLTIIFVTHDQDEALTMSDRIAVFNRGEIQQCASPREVYDHPGNRFVAEFIGETNLIEGKIQAIDGDTLTMALPDGTRFRTHGMPGLAVGAEGLLSLRPERIDIHGQNVSLDGLNVLHGEITDTVYQGDHLRVVIKSAAGRLIIVRIDRKAPEWPTGSQVAVSFRTQDGWVIAP
ncbi:Fe3+/spermidine/putrescine ABC transporter ATP-binding protein [Ensifer sp. Root31]|uniref:ABC transporter ATP-binding protein n=1 Tax=Ensifer sp. Root31 TaxID=1736512 RepID=UPI00070935D6|nr:ABC transporter ATP-binding protein [Ensifer sp. Root31]KQU83883.1 Fe3+/spermidine/putrescine ABC transporter ATP-binding protein [Ensifer sp. Root31]